MNKTFSICAAGWAAAWLLIVRQGAVTGMWVWVGCLLLALVALPIVLRRRRQPATLRALEAEAEAWCPSETRSHGIAPFVAETRSSKHETAAAAHHC